jgi:hypothetical protein
MILTKTTIGFVTQRYDTDKKRFIDQEFIGSDDRSWEDAMGDSVDAPEGKGDDEPYLNYEMKSPAEIAGINNFKKGDFVLVTPVEGDLAQHEFQGHVKGFRCGELITVEDQEGNCFDCYPDQLESLEEKDRAHD